MFFAVNFDIWTAMKKDIIPEIIIVERIIIKFGKVSSGISFDIATAAPVLVF